MSKPTKPPIRYEDAAERRTDLAGWVCKNCRRFYGDDKTSEHCARWCCAADLPCKECGGRQASKTYTCCDVCRKKHQDAKWAALPRVEWDGKTPLCEWDSDRYLYDVDAVQEHLDDCELTPETARLVVCEQQEPRSFDGADYFFDDLGEDGTNSVDFRQLDAFVQEWVKENITPLWYPTCNAVSVESLKAWMRKETVDA